MVAPGPGVSTARPLDLAGATAAGDLPPLRPAPLEDAPVAPAAGNLPPDGVELSPPGSSVDDEALLDAAAPGPSRKVSGLLELPPWPSVISRRQYSSMAARPAKYAGDSAGRSAIFANHVSWQ